MGCTNNVERTFVLTGDERDKHLRVDVHGNRVAWAQFNCEPDSRRLELAHVETLPEARGQGHAKSALRWITSRFAEFHVINSPEAFNSPEGNRLVAALRAEGMRIHDSGCYRFGHECRCILSEG
ncbi:hypothetical protein EXE58_06065 [Nocardioides seonyuensis]|uniref:N-acetyltransferase n=1 Tax=Nocardioides seonyuensis TaxID=2518371 RepID=A0A4P7IH43_9ACTN|nr:hypothetical protein [Nocardioides seonyuensis]QBX55061.1 hypothetical protein EXE58_06065 [Nocardioides seonyuensis]